MLKSQDQEKDNSSITITRVDWKTFQLEHRGKTVRVHRESCVPGCPRCFTVINELFGAAKAAVGVIDPQD